jgi:deazaflavin-dependent oxidoreductase (nitroreductase family)
MLSVLTAVATVLVAALLLVLLLLAVFVLKAAHRRPEDAGGQRHDPLARIVLGILTRLIRAGLRVGIRIGPMVMLTIPGRKTGIPRTNPVDLWIDGDHRYLVATHRDTAAWVRNLRAAGHGCVWYGRNRWTFTAVELSREEAGAILQRVIGPRLRRPAAGFVLRQTLRVREDASLDEFIGAAATHPVFGLTVTSGPIRRTPSRSTPTTA